MDMTETKRYFRDALFREHSMLGLNGGTGTKTMPSGSLFFVNHFMAIAEIRIPDYAVKPGLFLFFDIRPNGIHIICQRFLIEVLT